LATNSNESAPADFVDGRKVRWERIRSRFALLPKSPRRHFGPIASVEATTLEVLDVHVVRQKSIVRISHSLLLVPIEWAAKQIRPNHVPQTKSPSRPPNFALFTHRVSLTRIAVSSTLCSVVDFYGNPVSLNLNRDFPVFPRSCPARQQWGLLAKSTTFSVLILKKMGAVE
jgi:hypothetical protein